jgi:hypothetical protein
VIKKTGDENKELKEENEKLETLHRRERLAYLGADEENEKLKEELLKQKKMTLWRHCEGYIGGAEDADLSSPEWIQEMREAIEEISGWTPYDKQNLGTVEQLLKEYQEW